MVACGKLVFSFRKVERTTVGFGSSSDNINNESYYSRDMTAEEIPAVFLISDDLRDTHSAREDNDAHKSESKRELIANHLGTGTHRTDKGILIIRSPTCEEDTEHTDRRYGKQEENTDIEIDHLQTISPGEASEHRHRGSDDDVWSELEEEAVGAFKTDKLLDKDFEHIGEDLKETPLADAHRSETTLEPSPEFTFIKDIE